MSSDLDTNIQYLKGVGPHMARLFSKIGVFTVRDLLYYFPRDWEDRRNVQKISGIVPGSEVLLKGHIKKVTQQRTKRGFCIVKALVSDDSGSVIASWFNQGFVKRVLDKNRAMPVLISGKCEVNDYSGAVEVTVKDYEFLDPSEKPLEIVPKYPLTDGLYQKRIRAVTRNMISSYAHLILDPLPKNILEGLGLPALADSILATHFPSDISSLERYRRRLVFDDFFMLQLTLAIKRKKTRIESKGIEFAVDDGFVSRFENTLPFELTGAQRRVLADIKNDMKSSKPMNRLLQGDVGSGKTIVAVEAAVIAVNNGYQAAIMAPTEILAQQHYNKIKKLVEPSGISVRILTAGEKSADKKKVRQLISSDEPAIVVGTHALISEGVVFSNLGLVVVDEQHRFGVMERSKLKQKGKSPDLLVMTATPIPRTLSLTVYGDLDKSVIDELPPGRTPIITRYVDGRKRGQMNEFIRNKMKEGRQVYVVCPLIEESEKIDLAAARQTSEELSKIFPEFRVSLLHGKMKSDEKDTVMKDFKDNRINMLVSTTVIEVGIDVPNAVIMAVEHVERFGLSQLHQLRGRIGRGSEQSYCFLLGNPATFESKERVKAMIETTDGFKIAEADLRLRGPGEILGIRQSGLPEFKIADMIRDEEVLKIARKSAFDLVSEDPDLEKQEHRLLKDEMAKKFSGFMGKDAFN